MANSAVALVLDTKGHAYGDKVLAATGKCLSDSFRTSNCYRYGGDEFLIIGENITDEEFGENCAKARQTLCHIGDDVSFTGGYVYGVPDDIQELRTMIMQADEMLYQSKEEGKNQINGHPFDREHVPSTEATEHYMQYQKGNMDSRA
jgi:diguanylate cyclase (GGDEF)-like protein